MPLAKIRQIVVALIFVGSLAGLSVINFCDGAGVLADVISSDSAKRCIGEACGKTGYSEHEQDTCSDDLACLMQETNDRGGLEAIRALHRQLDDDANGNIDLNESDDFLREELKYEGGYEKRQKVFHQNDDTHISVKELWSAWLRSEVHNWTVEQTVEWLESSVGLPQYVSLFMQHKVDGAALPKLAANNVHFITNVLGIKDSIHKQKIALKAMDVVLFGPPKEANNYVKDVVLVSLLLGALGFCWYANQQNNRSKQHLQKMIKDMESLSKAEQALRDTQEELGKARMEQESVVHEKQNLEKLLQKQDSHAPDSPDAHEIIKLKSEVEILRSELQRAEVELEDKCWVPPTALQHWLQLSYELELKAYSKKKSQAEKQLQQAKEALRKKRSSLVGAFVSTHGKSIDDVDKSILEARSSLTEVTQDLQERAHRWKQIELLCGFSVVNNPGLQYLETLLRNSSNGRHSLGISSLLSASQDDLDDDSSSVYSPSAVAHQAEYVARSYQARKTLSSGENITNYNNSLLHSHTVAQLTSEGNSGSKAMHRSKSMGSMTSLKDKGRDLSSIESSNSDGKDSSNGEEETDGTLSPLPLDPVAAKNLLSVSSSEKKVSFGNSENSPSNSGATTPNASRRGNIVKSYSHDTTSPPRDIQATPRVISQSESSLLVTKPSSSNKTSNFVTLEEEHSTTDSACSNSVSDDSKKNKAGKKKKMFFQTFAKRNKTKLS